MTKTGEFLEALCLPMSAANAPLPNIYKKITKEIANFQKYVYSFLAHPGFRFIPKKKSTAEKPMNF